MEAMASPQMVTQPSATAALTGAGRARRGLAPSTYGFGLGLATGTVFFIIGFTSGKGPRVARLTGNPTFITLLELAAALLLVVGMVLMVNRSKGAPGASPLFGFLAGWCLAVAFVIAVAVFFDARSRLARFGLTAEGVPDPAAGTAAALTRKSHNTLAIVNAFLTFLGAFAVFFMVLSFVTAIVRSISNAVIRALRGVGIIRPEVIADF